MAKTRESLNASIFKAYRTFCFRKRKKTDREDKASGGRRGEICRKILQNSIKQTTNAEFFQKVLCGNEI